MSAGGARQEVGRDQRCGCLLGGTIGEIALRRYAARHSLGMPIGRRPKGSPSGGGRFAPSERPEDPTNVSPLEAVPAHQADSRRAGDPPSFPDTETVDATCIDCGAVYQTLTIKGTDPAELSILRCADCEI